MPPLGMTRRTRRTVESCSVASSVGREFPAGEQRPASLGGWGGNRTSLPLLGQKIDTTSLGELVWKYYPA